MALRTTCTINNSLKRIFLSHTDLSSQGSIAIAEFLPEMNHLIHLDLTENHGIDIAGVMALAVSVKMNTSLRCLDINIPPNDPDFAHLSQEILQSCVRNTEIAQEVANQRGAQTTIAQPMLKSTVVKALANQKQQVESAEIRQLIPDSIAARKPKNSSVISRDEIIKNVLSSTEETCKVLRDLISEDERRKIRILREVRKVPMIVECSELVKELLDQAQAGQFQIKEALRSAITDQALRARALSVHAQCAEVYEYAQTVYKESQSTDMMPINFTSNPSPDLQSSGSTSNISSNETLTSESDVSKPNLNRSQKGISITEGTRSSCQVEGGSPQSPTSSPETESSERIASSSTPSSMPKSLLLTPDHDSNLATCQQDDAIAGSPSSKVRALRIHTPSPTSSPRSPVESHSRSLTIEEGEVFRKGSVLGTVTGDDDEGVPGEVLKESILVAEVERPKRNSFNIEEIDRALHEREGRASDEDDEANEDDNDREFKEDQQVEK